MKKTMALIMSFMLLMTTAVNVTWAAAADTPVMTVGSVEGYKGDTVTLYVTLENNPGFSAASVEIVFDNTNITLTDAELCGDFAAGAFVSYDNLPHITFVKSKNTTESEFLKLTFTIAESAEPGDIPVTVLYAEGDISNTDENDVNFNVVPGKISVKEKPVPVTGITLDRETASIGTGDGTLTLTPIFSPETATNKNVKWASSDNTVATVKDGVVTPLKKGTTTITVTTEDGNFSASCVVTVNCSHLHTTEHPAEPSTCVKHGHNAYTVCDDCGEIMEGSDAELPLGEHTGGTATCIKKAICDVCHQEYGDFAAHNYIENAKTDYLKTAATCGSKAVYYKSCSACGGKSEETFETGEYDYTNHVGETYLKNQKEATCYEEGYTGDVYCSTCNREISKGQSIAKNAHNPASVWTTDETDHWKVCQIIGCGNIIDKAPHSGGEATCVNKAICSVCKVEYGEIDSSNHKHTEARNAKEATCCEKGYTGDIWCTDCNTKIAIGNEIPATGKHIDADGQWETDGTNHWHICYFGTKFDVTAHIGGEATCHAKAKCEICGVEYGDLAPDNHVNTEIRGAVAATEEAEGYTGDKWCLDCNQMIEEGTVVAKLDHTHAMVKTEAKAATCEKDGNIEYYTCSKCGKRYSDELGTRELTDEEIIIEASGHSYSTEWKSDADGHWHECTCGKRSDEGTHTFGDWTIIKEATATEDGSRERECSVCGYVQTETIRGTGGALEDPDDPKIPQTGDNSSIAVWGFIAILSLIALCVTTALSRKRRVK